MQAKIYGRFLLKLNKGAELPVMKFRADLMKISRKDAQSILLFRNKPPHSDFSKKKKKKTTKTLE